MIEKATLIKALIGTLIAFCFALIWHISEHSKSSLFAAYSATAILAIEIPYFIYCWINQNIKRDSTSVISAPPLKNEAKQILLACTRTAKRFLYIEKSMHFTKLEAGGVELFKGDKNSGEKHWTQALSTLEQYGFIRRVDDIKFELTNDGVTIGDDLRFESFENSEELKQLTYPAREMLIYAAKHFTHEIIRDESLTETEIKVGDREFCNTGYMSDYRNATQAFNQLLGLGLIQDTGAGFSYEVTSKGDQVANTLDSGRTKYKSA